MECDEYYYEEITPNEKIKTSKGFGEEERKIIIDHFGGEYLEEKRK